MLLIDDRVPPDPPADRPVWDPDWRTVAWIALTVAASIGAGVTNAFLSYVLLCVAVGCGGQSISRMLPSTFGLREYHQ